MPYRTSEPLTRHVCQLFTTAAPVGSCIKAPEEDRARRLALDRMRSALCRVRHMPRALQGRHACQCKGHSAGIDLAKWQVRQGRRQGGRPRKAGAARPQDVEVRTSGQGMPKDGRPDDLSGPSRGHSCARARIGRRRAAPNASGRGRRGRLGARAGALPQDGRH